MIERPLLPKHIVELMTQPVKDAGGEVKKIKMNPTDYADIRKFGRDVLDIVTEKEVLKTGHWGTMFNVDLHVDKKLSPEEFEVTILKNGTEQKVGWCLWCQKPIDGPFCESPKCVIEHVHES